MYALLQRKATDHLFNGRYLPKSCNETNISWIDEGFAYIKYDNGGYSLDFILSKEMIDYDLLLTNIFQLYGMTINNKMYRNIEKEDIILCCTIKEIDLGNPIKVMEINGVNLYTNRGGHHRLLLLLLIDPLICIPKIREIFSTSRDTDFFDTLEHCIKRTIDELPIKWLLISEICKEYIVYDIKNDMIGTLLMLLVNC